MWAATSVIFGCEAAPDDTGAIGATHADEESVLESYPMTPTEGSGDDRDDREIVCVAHPMEFTRLDRSLLGSGMEGFRTFEAPTILGRCQRIPHRPRLMIIPRPVALHSSHRARSSVVARLCVGSVHLLRSPGDGR